MSEIYNDVWIRGEVISRGVRPSEPRYEAIRPLLQSYTRSFTVLDLGAAQGYFSFRIADEFPRATVVALDGDTRLLGYCRDNGYPNVIHLHHLITIEELERLATCEHFDVVLAMNVVHHFGRDWPRAIGALSSMTDHLIIETPSADDQRACGHQYVADIHALLSSWKPMVLGSFESHTSSTPREMWHFWFPGNAPWRAYLSVPQGVDLGRVEIFSDFAQKQVYFVRKREGRHWIPGINLQTYLELGGVYPSGQEIAELVQNIPVPEKHHGDIRTWNFILSGYDLWLIDGGDDHTLPDDDDAARLKEVVEQLSKRTR